MSSSINKAIAPSNVQTYNNRVRVKKNAWYVFIKKKLVGVVITLQNIQNSNSKFSFEFEVFHIL